MNTSYSLPQLSFPLSPILPPAPALPAHDVLAIINQLEKAEQEILCQVQRVKEGIKEARASVESFRRHIKTKNKENLAENLAEKRQTRAVDGDFWMSM